MHARGQRLSQGGFRVTYISQSDPTKLLKYDIYSKTNRSIKKRGFVKDTFRMLRSKLGYTKKRLSGNQEELLGWQQIQAKGLEDNPYFTKVHGLVETDHGPALLVDKIDNFWNEDIRSISQYLKVHGQVTELKLLEALTHYFVMLSANNIALFADRPENMGILITSSGELYIKCFDVKTYLNHQLIPVHKIPLIRHNRIQRRLRRHFSDITGLSFETARRKYTRDS